jgi:hypothetical protein
MRILHLLHPPTKVDIPPFVDDFHLEIEVTLNWETFVYALVHSPHLSSDGLSSMVYELLREYFVPNDSASGSSKYVGTLLKVMFHFQYHVYFLHLNI